MRIFFIVSLNFLIGNIFSQGIPQGINYQGLIRNSGGSVLSSQNVSLRFTIIQGSINGQFVWQEVHATTTSTQGLFVVVVGTGVSTGVGTSGTFSQIDWSNGRHFIKVDLDASGGTTYTPMDTLELFSVPYALFSNKASALRTPLSLNDLADVDTTGIQAGQVLRWNGSLWIPSDEILQDTVVFSFQSQNAQFSDTAAVAGILINVPDTVNFSFYSDSSHYSLRSSYADSSLVSKYSDTANFAWNCGNVQPSWLLGGNVGTNSSIHFIGTTDVTDLVFKTNNLERLRLTSNGRLGIGTNAPLTDFHLVSNSGLLVSGTFGAAAPLPATGGGTRMFWYPARGAFRAGTVTTTQWDLVNIGNNSFAGGYNNIARGVNSFAMGEQNQALGANSAALGWANNASGLTSFAIGSGTAASGNYSIALGRGAVASGESSFSAGYYPHSTGIGSMAFGYWTTASGDYSLAMGYYGSTDGRRGSFIFADASTTNVVSNTADNQFMVRASGGYVFYTSSNLSSGVVLPAGSGSWSSLSDRNAKTNIRHVDLNQVLLSLGDVPVYTWNYKSQDSTIRHIGPMAQDFYKVFQLGESDTTISAVDADGINFAAIKILEQRTSDLEEKRKQIQLLESRLKQAEEVNRVLEERLRRLEEAILK